MLLAQTMGPSKFGRLLKRAKNERFQVRFFDQQCSPLSGHGWDVKCIDWHPSKGILASGAKDNLCKVWDPKSGKALATLYAFSCTKFSLSKDTGIAILS